ncbi:hypothetical protein PHYPO_G00073440 [Pangasianodon hypophthalmus]|uniref:Secreted protein n=1 Tax=Pangasianodon hypophthalmus TaxID=310915 RepID=A0A5N5LUJ2_PANHP|nr:hypothetical protein PHYPO_G00073440 [Pangasianodon hypophthalmus]
MALKSVALNSCTPLFLTASLQVLTGAVLRIETETTTMILLTPSSERTNESGTSKREFSGRDHWWTTRTFAPGIGLFTPSHQFIRTSDRI